jgi:structural maintenance of chromosome 4
MRFKKISELIHHSEKFPNLTEAKVSVHFQTIIDKEDGGFEVLENSSLVITRTANKKSKSYYYINDKKSNWTEVTKLLKKV